MKKTVVLLVGPKGCGKTSLGFLLESQFGLPFVRPEPLWLRHERNPRSSTWEREGILTVVEHVRRALADADCVVTETTGAADWFAQFVEDLRTLADVKPLAVAAPPEVCLVRVRDRDPRHHVSVSLETVATVNARSVQRQRGLEPRIDNGLPWDERMLHAALENTLRSLGIPLQASQSPLCRGPRVSLRHWHDDDLPLFAEMNADPKVMEFFPAPLSRSESDAVAARIRTHVRERGFGFFVLEIENVARFAGFVGLSVPSFETHFTPCVEVGWRLSHAFWGKGYASEGARLALRFAFEKLKLPEVLSFTVPSNHRSIRVMQRIGMHRSPHDDFEHPALPPGHPLRAHVVYRLPAPQSPLGS